MAQMCQTLLHGGAFHFGCHTKRVFVGQPDEINTNTTVTFYMSRPQSEEELSFLAWSRAMNTTKSPPQRYTRTKSSLTAAAVHTASKTTDAFYGQWLVANVPFRSPADLTHAHCSRMPPHKKHYMACRRLCPHLWDSPEAIQQWIAVEGSHNAMWTQNFLRMHTSWRVLTDYCVQHAEVPNSALDPAPVDLHAEQQRVFLQITARMQLVDEGSPGCNFALLGPAGCGKTALLLALLQHAIQQGKRVLLTTPTGALADSYRHLACSGRVVVDTIDGAFGLWDEFSAWRLVAADLVLVDELSFLSCKKFDALMEQRLNIGQASVYVFAGDFHQLGPHDGNDARQSVHWASVVKMHLRVNHRSRCGSWTALLNTLRLLSPTRLQLQQLVGTRVISPGWPTGAELQAHLQEHPNTVLLAVRRKDAASLNREVAQSLSTAASTLGLFQCVDLTSSFQQLLFEGARVMVTVNIEKTAGLVNGMFGTLLSYHSGTLLVRSSSGDLHAVHRLSLEREGSCITGFPVSLAYACTIAKVEGRTLPKVTILPRYGVPAAAYVAVSRVRRPEDIYWTERPLPRFFVPSRG